MTKDTTIKPPTPLMIAVYAPIPVIANGLAVASSIFLQEIILPESANQLFKSTPHWVILLARFGPTPIITFLSVLCCRPIIRMAQSLREQGYYEEKSLARLLNLPLYISLIGMGGWLLAYLVFLFAHFIHLPVFPLRDALVFFLYFTFIGSTTFVVSFYLMEMANRLYSVPRFIPDGLLSRIRGVRDISMQGRFFIYLYAVSGFVLFSFYFIIVRLNNNGQNSLGRDLFAEITSFLVIVLGLGALLTYVLARSYQSPLNEMRRATRSIRGGDFDVDVRVVSTDEIGYLGEGLNEMAAELREKNLIKDTFGRMVDPAVRDYLLQGNLELGGELKNVSILFSDIRDFTAMSESMEPRRIVELLNRYFERMGACITREGGLVNKFMGDSIMAIFGAPLEVRDHASAAVRAARAMLDTEQELNREFEADGLPSIRTGIGVHSGTVLAGNIGGSERMEYTVIGDSVNHASRIEGLCKKLQHNLIISQATANLLEGEFARDTIEHVQVKGKKEKIGVYRL